MQTLAPPARRLDAADLPWATELLAAALAGHPTLGYLCPAQEGPERATWLVAALLRYALLFGSIYTNPEHTALALWLPPGRVAITPARLLRAGLLPTASWRLGYAGCRRLQLLLAATGWLRRQSLGTPHHYLLALVVRPEFQGQGVGRRLLLATLAVRQGGPAPCYVDTQVPAHLPFYQLLGFRLVGHCTVGPGPHSLTNWGLVRTPCY